MSTPCLLPCVPTLYLLLPSVLFRPSLFSTDVLFFPPLLRHRDAMAAHRAGEERLLTRSFREANTLSQWGIRKTAAYPLSTVLRFSSLVNNWESPLLSCCCCCCYLPAHCDRLLNTHMLTPVTHNLTHLLTNFGWFSAVRLHIPLLSCRTLFKRGKQRNDRNYDRFEILKKKKNWGTTFLLATLSLFLCERHSSSLYTSYKKRLLFSSE